MAWIGGAILQYGLFGGYAVIIVIAAIIPRVVGFSHNRYELKTLWYCLGLQPIAYFG